MIEKLKRLHAEATPGPWEMHKHATTNISGIASFGGAWNNTVDPEKQSKQQEANAAGVAALRNALPAIITLLEAGQACADDLLLAIHQNNHGLILTDDEMAEASISIALWSAAKG